jgi:hypothetical protein
MKPLLLLGVLIRFNLAAFSQSSKLQLDYSFIGLSSNSYKTLPIVTVQGQILIYTAKSQKHIKYLTQLKPGTWDSIEQILNPIRDTSVRRINPCILSGGVYLLNVVSSRKTVHFSLKNTFDSTAYKNKGTTERRTTWAFEKVFTCYHRQCLAASNRT